MNFGEQLAVSIAVHVMEMKNNSNSVIPFIYVELFFL